MDINKALATFSKNSFKCRVFSTSQYQGQGISNLSNINQVGQVVLQKGHEQSITRMVSTASIFLWYVIHNHVISKGASMHGKKSQYI